MQFIDTINGRLNINELPLVREETDFSKITKTWFFFFVIFLICLIFFSFAPSYKNDKIPVSYQKPNPTKVETVVPASAVYVYCPHKPIFLENIILNTDDDNLINIDTIDNEFVVVDKKGNGISYFINLGKEYTVKSIILISDMYKHAEHVTVELYSGTNNSVSTVEKTWEFSGMLFNRRDNIIPITKIRESVTTDWNEPYNTGINRNAEYNTTEMYKKAKNIVNENSLQLQITEDSEEYLGF
jgi:hypothetical protein